MSYLPKSKYQIKESNGDFIYVDTHKIYYGKYIEIDDGTYLAGGNLAKANRTLIPINEKELINNRDQVKYKGIYNDTNENAFEFHSQVKKVIPRKPLPTSKDYKKRKFRRYFTKRHNSTAYMFEIDKETYDKIKGQSDEHDWHLYGIGTIEWDLTDSATRSNANIINLQKETFPHLKLLFSNLQEYYIPSNHKRQPLDRTKPNKKALAKLKTESTISKTFENREKRRKVRLQNKNIFKNQLKPMSYKGSTSSGEGGGY